MLFHPILNQIANLDMAFLVKPADEQRIEGQTACFCPLCQKEEADDGEQGKAKQTICNCKIRHYRLETFLNL